MKLLWLYMHFDMRFRDSKAGGVMMMPSFHSLFLPAVRKDTKFERALQEMYMEMLREEETMDMMGNWEECSDDSYFLVSILLRDKHIISPNKVQILKIWMVDKDINKSISFDKMRSSFQYVETLHNFSRSILAKINARLSIIQDVEWHRHKSWLNVANRENIMWDVDIGPYMSTTKVSGVYAMMKDLYGYLVRKSEAEQGEDQGKKLANLIVLTDLVKKYMDYVVMLIYSLKGLMHTYAELFFYMVFKYPMFIRFSEDEMMGFDGNGRGGDEDKNNIVKTPLIENRG